MPHSTQDKMQRFLRAELAPAENQMIVRHLLRRCRFCLEAARGADRQEGLRLTTPPAHQRAVPPPGKPAPHLAPRMG